MAATILSSPRAIEVSMYVVRAFVRMRELAATHGDLAKRLDELEHKTDALAMNHDTFSRNSRARLRRPTETSAFSRSISVSGMRAMRALRAPPGHTPGCQTI